jgi:hypothetical protein
VVPRIPTKVEVPAGWTVVETGSSMARPYRAMVRVELTRTSKRENGFASVVVPTSVKVAAPLEAELALLERLIPVAETPVPVTPDVVNVCAELSAARPNRRQVAVSFTIQKPLVSC